MADVTNTFYAGEAFIGYGSQFLIGQDDGSPETFVAVADVMQIQPGEMTTAVVQKTHLRSPDRHHEKLATLRDSGAFALSGNWRPTHGSQNNAGGDGFTPLSLDGLTGGGMIALWRRVEERNMKIILADTAVTEWPFRGVITKFQPGTIGLEEKVDFSAEVTPLQAFDSDLP